ncbi:unnamed protein product [Schistosoma turkestanicum]|nr:unnamed protein product [Schistosoma turkestanicum]
MTVMIFKHEKAINILENLRNVPTYTCNIVNQVVQGRAGESVVGFEILLIHIALHVLLVRKEPSGKTQTATAQNLIQLWISNRFKLIIVASYRLLSPSPSTQRNFRIYTSLLKAKLVNLSPLKFKSYLIWQDINLIIYKQTCSAHLAAQFRCSTIPVIKDYCRLHLNRKFSVETVEESTPKENNKEIECLKIEMQKLSERYNDLDDKYKRTLAESENMRKRLMKQIDEAKLFGIQSFCKDLLEVADILMSATQSAPQDQLKDGVNPPFSDLYHGLVLTENQLFKVFSRYNLVQISPEVGEHFDPNIHEAVFQTPLEAGKEKNTIAVVTKVGYQLHGRPLRPAFVGVFGP